MRTVELIVLETAVLLDGSEQHRYAQGVRDAILSLLCLTIGQDESAIPYRLAVVCGKRVVHCTSAEQLQDKRASSWAREMMLLMKALQLADGGASSEPAIFALPALLELFKGTWNGGNHITWLMPHGSRSLDHRLLPTALSSASGWELSVYVLPVSTSHVQASAFTSELILLQASFSFNVSALDEDPQAWAARKVALAQRIDVVMKLGSSQMLSLSAVPSILHQEAACNVPACQCHGVPFDSKMRALFTRDTPSQDASYSKCPITRMELDERDIQRFGVIGDFILPTQFPLPHFPLPRQGGLNAEAGAVDCLQLVVRSRIPLSLLSLSTLFGESWQLSAANESDDAPADSCSLRGLANVLHTNDEALLCEGKLRRAHPTSRPTGAFATLAHSALILIPQGLLHSTLLLKAIASASQILPETITAANKEFKQVSAEESRYASTLLQQVAVQDRFNPLLHCALELDPFKEILRTLEGAAQAGRAQPEVQNEHFNRRQQVAPVVYYQSVDTPASGPSLQPRQHQPMPFDGSGGGLRSSCSPVQKVNETRPYMWNTQPVRSDQRREPSQVQETSQHRFDPAANNSVFPSALNWSNDQHDVDSQQSFGRYSTQAATTPICGASSAKPRLGKRRMQRIPITES